MFVPELVCLTHSTSARTQQVALVSVFRSVCLDNPGGRWRGSKAARDRGHRACSSEPPWHILIELQRTRLWLSCYLLKCFACAYLNVFRKLAVPRILQKNSFCFLSACFITVTKERLSLVLNQNCVSVQDSIIPFNSYITYKLLCNTFVACNEVIHCTEVQQYLQLVHCEMLNCC